MIILLLGQKDKGAIVKSFVDQIRQHDESVKNIEEKWNESDETRKEFHKKYRLYKNIDHAWTVMLQRPDEYAEYVELLPKMDGIEERIKRIKDSKAKMKAETDFKRFLELEEKGYGKFVPVEEKLNNAKFEKDEARDNLTQCESDLVKLREVERVASTKITDDHILANEKGLSLGEFFPNVRVGFILSAFMGEDVENLDYKSIIAKVKATKPPHKCEFKRYDYRFNPFTKLWQSLAELRAEGRAVEDPMISIAEFVNRAGRGDIEATRAFVLSGEDPNAADYSGNSPLHMASVNGHYDVVDLLIKGGARIDNRDKNMMTPLLATIRKGNVEMIRMLLDLGANRDHTDRNNRGALFYSMISGNPNVAKMFLKKQNRNDQDKIWGYTALHIAATQGNISVVKALLDFNCSIYRRSNKGMTAEEVAMEAGHKEVAKYLETERLTAPGQLVYENKDIELQIWIGDHNALDPDFATDINISEVVFIKHKDTAVPNAAWLKDDDKCFHRVYEVDAWDDDDSDDSWNSLQPHFGSIIHHLTHVMRKGSVHVLICDPTGNSTCIAIFLAFMLINRQIRTSDSLKVCTTERPSVQMSLSLTRAIEILQQTMDDKKMKRLKAKLRNATIISTSF